ncbi:MAG: hypothetical protein GF411_19765 [Candidatus Lokiarchaeota archaeon]|nr:hypothetical protein [Candidatus Lokiarchaeota archaeon]
MMMQIETAGLFLIAMALLVLLLFIWLSRQNPKRPSERFSKSHPGRPDPKGSGVLSSSYVSDDSYHPGERASDKGPLPLGKKRERRKTKTFRNHSSE